MKNACLERRLKVKIYHLYSLLLLVNPALCWPFCCTCMDIQLSSSTNIRLNNSAKK